VIHRNVRALVLAGLMVVVGAVGRPSSARADATCTSLLNSKFSYLQSHGGWYSYTATVVKDSLDYVTFTKGYNLILSGSYLTNYSMGADQIQFSDRFSSGQNFTFSATEPMYIWIDQTGHLWIYNNLYSYYIVSNKDMSCYGNLISAYVSGLGVVTVRIGPWSTIF